MEPVFNPMLFDDAAGSSAERTEPRKTRAGGKSRAAEYIAALYIALLVCAPWLVREASLYRPSTGFEIHWTASALHPGTLSHAVQPPAR